MTRPLSLIICTRNRARQLKTCLEAIPVQSFKDHNAELIVVDNGSTDDTAAVIETYADALSFDVRQTSEPKAGLNRARNAGLHASTGEIVAYTDDDCYLADDFVEEMIAAFARGKFDYCGGRITLHDSDDARYIISHQHEFMTIPPDSCVPTGLIQGANMAFRRSVVETVGDFDNSIGVGTPYRCGDIDYCARASLAGFIGAFVPEISVAHHHGRKEGEEIESLKRENDFARGAYYMKFILQGHSQFRSFWFRHALRRGNPAAFARELRGARSYRDAFKNADQ